MLVVRRWSRARASWKLDGFRLARELRRMLGRERGQEADGAARRGGLEERWDWVEGPGRDEAADESRSDQLQYRDRLQGYRRRLGAEDLRLRVDRRGRRGPSSPPGWARKGWFGRRPEPSG